MENYIGLIVFYLLLWLGIRLYNSKDDFSFLGWDEDETEEEKDDKVAEVQGLLDKLPDGFSSLIVAASVTGHIMVESINIFGLLIVSQLVGVYAYIQMACIAAAVIAIAYTIIDSYNHYLYVNCIIYHDVDVNTLFRYTDIYRVKLLSDYTDTFIYAVSILAAIVGLAVIIFPSLV